MFDASLAGAIALKSGILLLVAAMVVAAFTRRSSAFRHAVWTGTLLLSLLMPFAVLMLPKLGVIPATWQLQQTVAPAAAQVAAQVEPSFDFWAVGWKLWLAAAACLLLRLLVAQLALLRWQLRARPLHSRAWTGTLERVSSRMPTPRSMRVLESSAIANPCTWGFFRPVLLLPTAGESWSEDERRLALLHELAHVRRRDWMTATLGRLACAVHWYNPLAWLAARESERLQEQACDDFVLQSGALPSDYAAFLRHAAADEHRAVPQLSAALGILGHSDLRDRVDSILDPVRKRTPLTSARAFGLSLASVCIALFLGAVAQESPARSSERSAAEADVEDEGHSGEEYADEEDAEDEFAEAEETIDEEPAEDEFAQAEEDASEPSEESDESAEELAREISEEVYEEVSEEVDAAVEEALAEVVAEEEAARSESDERPQLPPVPPVPPVPPLPAVPPVPPVPAVPPVPPVPPDNGPTIHPDTTIRE